jgi:hypothetical protein
VAILASLALLVIPVSQGLVDIQDKAVHLVIQEFLDTQVNLALVDILVKAEHQAIAAILV